MLVKSHLPKQTTKIFHNLFDVHLCPHCEKASALFPLQHLAGNFRLVYVTFDNLNAKAFDNESRSSLILKNAESWVSKTRSLSDINIIKKFTEHT